MCVFVWKRRTGGLWPKKQRCPFEFLRGSKKGLDRAAGADKRSTSALVEIILADYLAAAGTSKSKKFPNPDEHLAAGGQLLDSPMPNGKKLGDATGVGRAYGEIAKQMKKGEQARKHK
jgi:hypothetical protein